MQKDIVVGFAGDLHKRHKAITTIEGYVECHDEVQKELMQKCKDVFDYFVSLGDWYDKGYSTDLSAGLADTDMDKEMANILNGNFYGVIGNHIRLNMDSNPELHLIQPHHYYKSRKKVSRTYQIIRTPEYIRIYDVQISLVHHNKQAEASGDVTMYKVERQEWAKYHIAVFHTPLIVPNAQLIKTRYGYNTSSNSKIGQVLQGIDLAICGDIHTPIGQFPVVTETGTTIMVVPGSLTNTDASEETRHNSIMMPVTTISPDSTVKLEYMYMDLKTNLLTFKEKNVKESTDKLKSVRGKKVDTLYEGTGVSSVSRTIDGAYTSLNAFMQSQRYTNKDKSIVRHIINDPTNLDVLMRLYMEAEL